MARMARTASDQRAELRPLQDVRHQGPDPEHQLGHARRRWRAQLSEHVDCWPARRCAAIACTATPAAARITGLDPARAYVEARAAAMNGDHARSAELLATIARAAPAESDIARKALGEAIGAGRIGPRAAACPRARRRTKLASDARLLLVADELRRRTHRPCARLAQGQRRQWRPDLPGAVGGGLGRGRRRRPPGALAILEQVPQNSLLGPLRAEQRPTSCSSSAERPTPNPLRGGRSAPPARAKVGFGWRLPTASSPPATAGARSPWSKAQRRRSECARERVAAGRGGRSGRHAAEAVQRGAGRLRRRSCPAAAGACRSAWSRSRALPIPTIPARRSCSR